MERKKVLVLKGNQVLEINLNLLAKIDQIDLQEMERKKVLVLKGKSLKAEIVDLNFTLKNTAKKDRSRFFRFSFFL